MGASSYMQAGAEVRIRRVVSFGAAPGGSYLLGDRPAAGSSEIERVLVFNGSASHPAGPAVVIPSTLEPDAALLVPIVAEALRAWDGLHPEIGAAAVVTDGSIWSDLFVEVGSWYGARPLRVALGVARETTRVLDMTDPTAVAAFRKTLGRYPVVCAVELTGRAAAAEFFFESVPSQARVLFAGPAEERLTIDYYVNVHRKGLHLKSTVLDVARCGTDRDGAERTARAIRLLRSASRTRAVHAALGPSVAITEA
jgi:hypothetical protein